jgi:hypothetical protein
MKKKKPPHEQTVDQKNVPELASFLIIVFALLYTSGWSPLFWPFQCGLECIGTAQRRLFYLQLLGHRRS